MERKRCFSLFSHQRVCPRRYQAIDTASRCERMTLLCDYQSQMHRLWGSTAKFAAEFTRYINSKLNKWRCRGGGYETPFWMSLFMVMEQVLMWLKVSNVMNLLRWKWFFRKWHLLSGVSRFKGACVCLCVRARVSACMQWKRRQKSHSTAVTLIGPQCCI